MENKPYFSIKSMEDVMNMLKYSVHRIIKKEKKQEQERQKDIGIKRKTDEEEKETNNVVIPQPNQNIFYQNAAQNQSQNYGPAFTSYLERRQESLHDLDRK